MGTKQGGNSAASTNRKLYGADFYSRIGAKGGKKRTSLTSRKGFGSNRELASKAGRIGKPNSRKELAFV
jgi:hypothetical protein